MKSPKRAGWEGVSVEKIDGKNHKIHSQETLRSVSGKHDDWNFAQPYLGRDVFRRDRLKRDEHEADRFRAV